MSFENATPRPWTKDIRGHLNGSNGERVVVFDLGAARASYPPTEKERDNAELFLAAVNAHEASIEALDNLLILIRAHTGPDDAIATVAIEQAEAALKLARAET